MQPRSEEPITEKVERNKKDLMVTKNLLFPKLKKRHTTTKKKDTAKECSHQE
jgi:hypothetical protein